MRHIILALVLMVTGWTEAQAGTSTGTVAGKFSLLDAESTHSETELLVQNYEEMEDVVYLKNGSTVRGMITEQIPSQQLKIQTRDGSVFVFKMEEIDKIAKERVFGIGSEEQSYTRRVRESQSELRSPAIGFLLSFLLLSGAGQYYNGAVLPRQHIKGAVFTVASVAGMVLLVSGAFGSYYCSGCAGQDAQFYSGYVLLLGSKVWSSVDALVVARRINKREYPSDDVKPSWRNRYDGGQTISLLPLIHLSPVAGSATMTPTYGLQASYAF